MARTSTLSLSALALAASSAHALPSADVVPSVVPLGDATVGRFSVPIEQINQPAASKVLPRYRSQVDVGSNWYIKVWIGTPGESFYLLADSGAPNLSIESTLLPPEAQGDVPKYDPTKSSTAQQIPGMTYSECFGSGYCDNGVVYRDVFTVGQIGIRGMPIMVQTNNTAKSYGIRSGNLGLNIDRKGMTTRPNRLPTWFETVMPHLDAPLWTVDWHNSTQSGQFQFGWIDSSKYVGEIAYGALATTGGLWTIQVQGVGAGYDDAKFHAKKFQVVVDTGTSGGTISRAVADLYWRGVPNSRWDAAWNNYLYPCGQVLPDFVIKLADGRKVGIPDEGLRWKGENGWCATKLAVGGNDDTLWGARWIQNFFVVFDWGNSRVGLAKKSRY